MRKHFHAWIEMYSDEAGNVDEVIAKVGGQMNKSRWDAMAQLFIWGLEIASERLEDDALKQELRRFLTSKKLADALSRERRYDKEIFAGVRELGKERAMEIAEREGLSREAVERILQRATPRERDMPHIVQMEMWLITVMGDHRPRNVKEIKQLAIDNEMLPPMSDDRWDGEWNTMRGIASRKNWTTSRKGVWQMPESEGKRLDD